MELKDNNGNYSQKSIIRHKYRDIDQHLQNLIENGLINVIPIKGGKKEPKVEWIKYKSEKYPISSLKRHRGNFGVITGDPLNSGVGHLVILDIDDKKGKNGLYKHFKNLDTIHVETACKGFHIYMWSKKPVKNPNNIGHVFNIELELRGSPKFFTLIPPSFIQCEDGTIGGHKLIKMGSNQPIMDVEDAEEFIKDILLKSNFEVKNKPNNVGNYHDINQPIVQHGEWRRTLEDSEIKNLCKLLKLIYNRGKRDFVVLYLSGWLYKAEIDFNSAKSLILRLCENDEEKEQRINTLKRTYNGDNSKALKGSSGIKEILQKVLNDEKLAKNELRKMNDIIVHPLSKINMLYIIKSLNNRNEKTKILRHLADFIIRRYDPIIDSLTKDLYIYDHVEKHYKLYDIKEFQKFITNLFPDFTFFEGETNKIMSAFTNIKHEDQHMIIFENGILNCDTLEITKPNPEIFAKFRVPYSYNPQAKSELMEKTLKEILCDNSGENKYNFFLELLGYCFEYGNRWHLITLIVGEGGNGKSTLMHLISTIFEGYTASVPLHDFKSNFGLEPLINAKVNILYDIPDRDIKDTGIIKAATGEDTITIKRKYKSAINMVLPAKMIGTGNKLPRINDETYGFWRRIAIIKLMNQFSGKNRDPDIKNKLVSDKEGMEWLIHQGIKAYRRVKETGNWSMNFGDDITEEEYLKESNPCLYAAKKLFKKTNDENDFITRGEVVKLISELLNEEGLKTPANNTEYYRAIRDIGGEDAQRRNILNPVRGFSLITTVNESKHPIHHRLLPSAKVRLCEDSENKMPTHDEMSDNERALCQCLVEFGENTVAYIIEYMKNEANLEREDTIKLLRRWRGEEYIKIFNS